ncbi:MULTISPECIES: hypothetical protein [Pseudonocardia]|uniref:Uncharacterized protein n=1 Tax=Pseudonocardia oroxyli TaxID=366584 RepID=A0A1G7LE27_PSEOR|nr:MULTISPECIES: hypothetical protein [Pseudonocardia]MCF7552036.1 hypothetical protein [Pseudonocardia sp. WMMC193]SDF47723.1 hypothetical protein SAMN05216377_10558 [Pseudonocardia oroxyli]
MNTLLVDQADFDLVLARWLRDTERTAPNTLLLTFDPAAAAAVCVLAETARQEIEVGLEDGQLLAQITVPAEQADLLDEIVVRAETADLRALRRVLAA